MFVLEGVRLVADLLQGGHQPQLVLYDPLQLASTAAGQALLEQISTLPQAHPASPDVIKTASDTNTPQGVIAVADWPHFRITQPSLVVVCDEIQDPGNMGTIIRSCDAIGVDAVYCSVGCVDVYSPKCVRASMGSIMRVPIIVDQRWDTLATAIAHTTIYAADAGPRSIDYCDVDWLAPSTLIVGNEARGISQAAQQLAQHTVVIPMRAGIESLNAAMATSIILFEAQRQRRLHS
jgi:TrmH family RNA methyltransferase